MKVTIEIPDELREHTRRVAEREGSSLWLLVQEGLQRCLDARRKSERLQLNIPSYGGSGLTPEFEGADWNKIRDAIYSGRGA